MIYLAQPYSHPDREVELARFKAGVKAMAQMMQEGLHVFSPIAMSHPLAVEEDIHQPFEYWKALDFDFIDRCDEVVVLLLPYWSISKGVTAEIAYAEETGKPVSYRLP